MSSSEYIINKGVNAEIEFRGLRGQWLYYLGGGLAAILILFVILYLCGVNTFICLSFVGISGGYLFWWVYRANAKFGPHGLLKQRALRMMPKVIKNYSRRAFMKR